MKRSILLLTAGLVFTAHSAFAEDSAPKPDDSKVNAIREHQKLPTADNSGNSKVDVNLAASIRKALVANDDLSSYAKNVKIIVNDQTVRLSGPVRTSAEKDTVEAIATSKAGAARVVSELEVAPK